MKSTGVRILVVAALIGLYWIYPMAGVGALATVFGFVIAQRVRSAQ